VQPGPAKTVPQTGRPSSEVSGASSTRGKIRSVFFDQILLDEGILRPEDLRRLMEQQRGMRPEDRRPIGWLAVAEGVLTEARLLALLDGHGWKLHLGELLVMRGHLALNDLNRAIDEQGRSGGWLGEILLRMRLVDDRSLAEGLAEQCGVASFPVANISPDPELARWINPSFARAHGMVPVHCRGRSLVVAAWQPRSLALASDIEQATGLAVCIVLTTRKEVEERIQAVYLPPEREARAA
jgi:hypothetical protein